ncbi:MAG: DNA-binding response regulator [Anaerolinea sp.]|nr:DNA-binding response regulator [Anaerolinea sp.]
MTTLTLQMKEGVDLDHKTPGEHPRILLIDDEPDNIILLKLMFQSKGFDVSGACSGKEALKKIHEVKPNLIILDIMMPEMDGWQTYQELRKLSELPVIVVSAARQTENVVKALQMGMDDYITKPFDQAEVVARVNCVLRRSGKKQKVNRLGFSMIELILDLDSQEIVYKGERIQLTGRMFEVLLVLAKNAPRVLPYDEITKEIWGETSISAHNRLKYLVYLLRQEFLRIDATNPVIKNIDRVGYKLTTEN